MSSATLSSDEAGFSAWLFKILNKYRTFQSSNKNSQQKYSFPILTKNQIKSFTAPNFIRGRILESVKNISELFTFDQISLLNIFSTNIDSETRKLIIVASSIAWVGLDKTRTTQQEFYLLFSVLTKCLKKEFCDDFLASLFLVSLRYKKHGLSSIQTDDILLFCRAVNTNKKFHNESMHVISILVDLAMKAGDAKSVTQLVQSATLIISSDPDSLEKYDFSELVDLCSEGCKRLDVDMLTLLAAISEVNKSSIVMDVYKQLPTTISDVFPDEEFPVVTPPEKIEIDVNVNIENFSCIELSNDDNVVFDSISIEDYLSTDQLEILGMFQPFISSQSKDLTTAFIEEFASIIEQRENAPISLYALFFSLLRSYQQQLACDMIFRVLTKTRIMCEDDSFFVSESPFSQLRQYACEILIESWPAAMKKCLLLYRNNPIIFAELCGRIKQYVTANNADKLIDSEVIQIISRNIVVLVNARRKSKCAHKAWETLFNFVVSSTKFCGKQFFSDTNFCRVSMLHILSKPLEQSVFIIFKSYLIDAEEEEATTIIRCSAFFVDSDSIPEQCTSILCHHINDILCENPDLGPSFAKLGNICLEYYIRYPKADGALSLLTTLAASDNLNVSQKQAILIGEGLRTIYTDGIDIEDHSPSLTLIAKKKNLSQSNSFLVNDPNFVLMIFVIAKSLTKAANFFMNLCEYSQYNCLQAHRGRLDLLLIEAIRNFPNSFEFADHLFMNTDKESDVREVFIPLIEKIAGISCSDEVGRELLSLTVPTDDKFPIFAEDVLTLINMGLTQKIHDPNVLFEYNANFVPTKYDVKEDLTEGFSFSAWVLLDSPAIDQSTAQPIIISLNVGGSLILFFNGASLYCQVQSYTGISSAVLCQNFPSCKWTLISFALIPKSEDTSHILFSTDTNKGHIFIVHNPLLKPEGTAQIGGFTDANPFVLKHTFVYLGPYSLNKGHIESSEVLKIYSQPDDCDGGLLSPLKMQKESEFVTLTDVVNKKTFTDNLTPFFAVSSKCPNNFLERIIDIMQFVKQPFNYKLICSALKMSCGNSLTYRMYSAFAELLSSSWSHDLLFSIVLNIDLWSRCKSIHLVRIVSHWSQVIFPTYGEYIASVLSFKTILVKMRQWLWFTALEEDSLGAETRDKNLDVAAIRENVVHILCEYASLSLTMDDVRSVISHIVTTPDQQQIFSLLLLLQSIAPFIKNKKETINYIIAIMEDADSLKFISAFNAYCCLTENYDEMTEIINNINDSQGRKMYDNLIKTNNVLMLPIIFKIAAKNSFIIPQQKLAISVEEAKELSRYKLWYIWPSIYAATLSAKNSYIVMFFVNVFIQNKTVSTLTGIFTTLEATIIALSRGKGFTIDLLKSICDFSSPEDDSAFNSTLLILCLRFGLFSKLEKEGTTSQALMNEYKESPFFAADDKEMKNNFQDKNRTFDEGSIFNVAAKGLYFKTELNEESVLTVRRLLIGMTRIISFMKNDDEICKFARKVVGYYIKCETYSEEKKYTKISKLTPLIYQRIEEMNNNYAKMFEANVATIKSKVSNFEESKEEIIPREIVSLAFAEMTEVRNNDKRNKKAIDEEWNVFSQRDQKKTIWKNFIF